MAEKTGIFAQRLKDLRREAKLSQPALADKAAVPVGTIRGFEAGRREPTYATLIKLAKGLGVSLAAFEAIEQPEKKPAPKKRKGK